MREAKARIDIKVVPRASRDELVGWMDQVLRVRVRAAPERGRANEAVEQLLAESVGVSGASVRVVAGHTSTRKVVEIQGLDADELRSRVGAVFARLARR